MAKTKKAANSSNRQDDRLQNAEDIFDFEKGFEYLEKELDELFSAHKLGRNKGMRYVDKLIKVFLKDGSERFILVHAEVQSHRGKGNLGRRMADYYILIRQKYKVPITAIAILADGNRNYRPSSYTEAFLGTELTYKFISYKIIDQQEDVLRANPNPFALVVLTALMAILHPKADDDALMAIKRELYHQMKARRMPKYTRAGIYDFLKYYVSFADSEQFVIFEQETQQLEGRSNTVGTTEYLLDKAERKGIEKGIEKGMETERAKAHADKLKSALKMKKSGFDKAMIADVLELPIDEVDKL